MSSYVDGDVIENARIDWEKNKIFREEWPGNKELCFSYIEFETDFRHLNRVESLRRWERL